MRTRHAACVAALTLACGGSSSTTAAEQPAAPSTPEATGGSPTMTATARETPWSLHYADGAANVYHFSQREAGGEVSFEYVPVTPEQSSTGSYSGGDPREALLAADDPRVAELWQRVEALEADTASHGPDRNKGTGAFSIVTPAGKRAFIVEQGAALDEIHSFMKGFRE